MRKTCGHRLTAVVLAAAAAVAQAGAPRGDDLDQLLSLPLKELMQIPVSTASDRASPWRDQPGVLTVFSGADIRSMGAKTLLDILQRIPGTSLGIDGRNSIGLVMRGNWTLEGKILVLMDDMPINELLYGAWSPLPFIPVSRIDRVEVLRGPGSAKYGGNAQLAVIRIYSRQYDNNRASVDYTQLTQSGTGSGMLSAGGNFSVGELKTTINGSANDGHWGNERWIDNTGTAYDTDAASTSGATLALDSRWRDSRFKAYHEDFSLDPIQGFGAADLDSSIDIARTRMMLSQEITPASTLRLSPALHWRDEHLELTSPAEPTVFDIGAHSLRGAIDASWNVTASSSLAFGADYEDQQARANETSGPFFTAPTAQYFNGRREQSYYSHSYYGDWDLVIGDYRFTAGARVSDHSYAGDRITPRFGLTRTTNTWHVKWLYGRAFREPNIETIHYGTTTEKLDPEITIVHEIELGYQLQQQGYLTLSLFDQRNRDSIIFTQDRLGELTYNNSSTLRTEGVELQYLYKSERLSLQLNYSRVHSNDNGIPMYDVVDRSGAFLGTPEQVANLWLEAVTPIEHLSLLLGLRHVGARSALLFDATLAVPPGSPALTQGRIDAENTINAGARYDLAPLTLTAAVDNVTDEKQLMPQPYTGNSTPFPYASRTFWLRGEWRW